MFISHAVLDGRYVLRLAVGQMSTTEADVRLAWEVLRREAETSGLRLVRHARRDHRPEGLYQGRMRPWPGGAGAAGGSAHAPTRTT